MATAAINRHEVNQDVLNAIVAEMASGVEQAVECWIAQIDQIYRDTRLTTLGRMNAIHEVIERYKRTTGKTHLVSRNQTNSPRRLNHEY